MTKDLREVKVRFVMTWGAATQVEGTARVKGPEAGEHQAGWRRAGSLAWLARREQGDSGRT